MELKELRKQKGMTQKQCADFLGIPLRTYIRYEKKSENFNVKYRFMFEKLQTYGLIDENHGVLTVDKIKEICSPIFKKNGVDYCYLFGSYAKGKQTDGSDVDLLVSSSLKGIKFFGLVEELRTALKKKVDVIDQMQIENNFELMQEILKDGVKIYG